MVRAGIISLCVCAVLAVSATAATTSQVSQFGITWTFAQPVAYGQFANGDYWVVGPVQITSISPPSTTAAGRTINGSMINPRLGMTQGYDSAMYGTYGPAYSVSMNKAPGVSAASPLTVATGSSLISSISIATAGNRPQLKTAAVLTVLSAPAPAGSFRPPYFGSDKTIRYNKAQLDYSKLPRLASVAGAPALTTVAGYFQRPWLEHVLSWTGRYCHPSDNMPDYGENIALRIGDATLSLCLDYTDQQKETLLIRLVQYGIDLYAIASGGGVWEDLGGHMHGRKLPIMLAGLVLDDAAMLGIGASLPMKFQEDRQTWYVTQADVGRPLYQADGRPRDEYIQADVGVPEWGEQHYRQPKRDGRNWSAYYRSIVGHSIIGPVLAANILDLRERWQWEALFEYIDRYWSIEGSRTSGTHLIPTFHKNMWLAHRNTVHSGIDVDAGEDREVLDDNGVGFAIVTLDGSASSSPNGPIVGYYWTEGANYIGDGPTVITVLSTGTHTIKLRVIDSTGAEGTDTVVITVRTPQVVADAGEDRQVADVDGDGYELVFLDGSGSYHRNGTLSIYWWTEGGTIHGMSMVSPAFLAVGVHTITLTVIDTVGERDTDTVVITVTDGAARKDGDANEDGNVDIADFVILKNNFGRTDATWSEGDFTGDGNVDIMDFVILKNNFGQ